MNRHLKLIGCALLALVVNNNSTAFGQDVNGGLPKPVLHSATLQISHPHPGRPGLPIQKVKLKVTGNYSVTVPDGYQLVQTYMEVREITGWKDPAVPGGEPIPIYGEKHGQNNGTAATGSFSHEFRIKNKYGIRYFHIKVISRFRKPTPSSLGTNTTSDPVLKNVHDPFNPPKGNGGSGTGGVLSLIHI